MSKQDRQKRRRKALETARAARKAAREALEGGQEREVGVSAPTIARAPETRPTREQRAKHAHWQKPAKGGHWKNAAPDMIGRLYAERRLTYDQHEAARTWQELRADFEAELGVSGYRSCLDGSQGGHDSGDGNPGVIAAYRAMETKLGRVKIARLKIECDRTAEAEPLCLEHLRVCLDAINR